MLTLVTGGSASGKSAYSELLLEGVRGPKVYLATMRAYDAESLARIEKHRAARAGRGFLTLEQAVCLSEVRVPPGSAVLLECLSTLVANELFSPDGAGQQTVSSVLEGLFRLEADCAQLVVVSNEVFADGIQYDAGTLGYLRALGALHSAIAARAHTVVEVVYGLPIFHKKEETCL